MEYAMNIEQVSKNYLSIAVLLVVDNLCRPVGEALLLGVHNLVERTARLRKPVLVPPCVGVPGNQIMR